MNNHNELQRCERVLTGTELKKARYTGHRLDMAAMGISSSNLVFDSELASEYLSPEILEILKDNPEGDDSVMTPHIPREVSTHNGVKVSLSGGLHFKESGISDSTQSFKLDTAEDDDLDNGLIPELSEDINSGAVRVLENLKFYVDEKQCWRYGFNPIKFARQAHLITLAGNRLMLDDEHITTRGTVRQRAPRKVSSATKRVARKRGIARGLSAK